LYRKLVSGLLVAVGTLLVLIGILGIFLPLLPTTPFLLLAAAAYAKSSRRLHGWLLNSRWLGELIRAYTEGRGVPLRFKISVIAVLWVSVLLSAFLAVDSLWIRIILFAIASITTTHVVTLPTARAGARGG
jgi:uncharacterized membrane protein YbaN (DUF454 family)